MIDIEVSGIEDLFKNMDATKAIQIQRRALRAGGKIEQAAIEEAAPVAVTWHDGSNALPPGVMKTDVYVTTVRNTDAAAVRVHFGKYVAHVARFLEYGFAHYKKGKFVQRPFWRQAVDGVEAAAKAAIQASLEKDIQQAFKTGTIPAEGNE